MSENNNARILRFHLPDKVFHSMNAILWFALVITGAIVYLCDLDASTGEMLMTWHIGLGIAFVPDYCLPKHSCDLFPLTLAEELPSRQLMLVHSEQLPLSPAAKQFLEYFTAS